MRPCLTVGSLLAVITASGGGGAAVSADAPRAQLRDFVCRQALDPPARLVSVSAVMRPVPGTVRLALRFDLLREPKGRHRFVALHGRDLGSWIAPDNPTLGQLPNDTWILDHPVVDLTAPASYRFRVTFRWSGRGGSVLDETTRSTRVCYEPELRPDLLVRSITVRPAGAATSTYLAVIANRGATGAGPFDVTFTGAGTTESHTIERLGPRASVDARFTAPACVPGSTLTVTADPEHRVDDYDLANNSLTVACPVPSGSSAGARYTR